MGNNLGNNLAKQDKEIATKDTYLECPVLVDLDHGTIRHRHEEVNEAEKGSKKIGYFYHPKLNDFSEEAIVSGDDNNRLKYVFKGPSKDLGQRLYYIYGTNATDQDKGIHHNDGYKPKGKGYNWPESYRKANNLYYNVIFLEKQEGNIKEDLKENDDADDDSSSFSSGIIVVDHKQKVHPKDNMRMKLRGSESVGSVIERVSLHLLIPCNNIHLLWKRNELSKTDLIINLKEKSNDEDKIDETTYLTILLRLT